MYILSTFDSIVIIKIDIIIVNKFQFDYWWFFDQELGVNTLLVLVPWQKESGFSIISMNLTRYKFNKAGVRFNGRAVVCPWCTKRGRGAGLMIKRLDPGKDNGA